MTSRSNRWISLFLASVMIFTLAGCSSGGPDPASNYGGGTMGGASPAQQPQQGMSTKTKVALLVGAAALAYMYNKNKNNKGRGPQGQYYRSKNGRVYYRDAQGKAIWVTPPQGGIRVPANEAQRYERMASEFEYAPQRGGDGY